MLGDASGVCANSVGERRTKRNEEKARTALSLQDNGRVTMRCPRMASE